VMKEHAIHRISMEENLTTHNSENGFIVLFEIIIDITGTFLLSI
jgi:hypothetical protein